MREIKFRAWDEKEKCWVGGFAIHQSGMFSDWAGCKKINGQCVADADWKYQHEIPHIKIVQYTGLKDKNGKEIYEGDIVSTDLSRPFNIVVFRNGAFMFQCHDNGKDYYDYMFSVDEESDRWEYGEVIGNIYETPELLKGEGTA